MKHQQQMMSGAAGAICYIQMQHPSDVTLSQSNYRLLGQISAKAGKFHVVCNALGPLDKAETQGQSSSYSRLQSL